MLEKVKRSEVKRIAAPRFTMSPLELHEFADFEVKRMYFITDPVGEKITGSHCHLKEEELFVVAKGTCTFVYDDGEGVREWELSGPQDAVYVPNWAWHHFKNLSDDLVLIALSSTNYNPNREDYIEDYEEFVRRRSEMV